MPIDQEHFPDEKFRSYIIDNIDTDNNGILSRNELVRTTSIDIFNNNISSLSTIEYFIELQVLNCSWNNLKVLDVSKNTALQNLICRGNYLTTLDVSKNMELQELICEDNQLTKLDLRNCIKLTSINVICDRNVDITWSASANSATTNMYEVSKHASSSNSDYTGIIAFISPFKASFHTLAFILSTSHLIWKFLQTQF